MEQTGTTDPSEILPPIRIKMVLPNSNHQEKVQTQVVKITTRAEVIHLPRLTCKCLAMILNPN